MDGSPSQQIYTHGSHDLLNCFKYEVMESNISWPVARSMKWILCSIKTNLLFYFYQRNEQILIVELCYLCLWIRQSATQNFFRVIVYLWLFFNICWHIYNPPFYCIIGKRNFWYFFPWHNLFKYILVKWETLLQYVAFVLMQSGPLLYTKPFVLYRKLLPSSESVLLVFLDNLLKYSLFF